MALRSPDRVCCMPKSLSEFESVKLEIINFFEILFRKITERKDELLEQLENIKSEYLKKEESRESHISELEKMLRRTSGITIHENLIESVKLDQINNIKAELEVFQQLTPIPSPFFKTEENLKDLLRQLGKIGEVEIRCAYRTKVDPVKTVGKGELDRPFGICIDQDGTIYVCDCGNKRVQIVSKDGEFISELGKGELDRPHGIAVNRDYVFVVDWELNTVFKFQKSDHKLVKMSVGVGLHSPKDLAMGRDGNLLIVDCHNNRIAILNSDLAQAGEMGKGVLKYPCGVNVNLNKIYVIDFGKQQNVHVFSQSGELLHNMISLKLTTSLISKNFGRHRIFLCFDQFGNIIVSVTDDKLIHIFTIEGNLKHSIKCEGYPTGIAVNEDDVIVCAMFDPSSIKFF